MSNDSRKPRKILISVVGDPKGYKDAVYSYEREKCKSAFSSYVVSEVEKPDESILVGQYTLSQNLGSSFKDLSGDSRSYLEKSEKLRLNSKSKVIVSPGVMSISLNGEQFLFRGDIYNFYAYTLYSLAKEFQEIQGDVEVILDLTHGVNYMAYLTLRAISIVLDIYSLKWKATLKVVNSDPYPIGGQSDPNNPPSLNINKVLEEEVKPSFKYPAREGCIRTLAPSSFLLDSEKEEVGESIRKTMAKYSGIESKYFLNSINHGSILAMYTFAYDFETCVNNAVKEFENNVEVKQRHQVLQKVSFTPSFESFVIADTIKKIIEVNREPELAPELALEKMIRMANIYETNSMLYTIVNNELNGIKEKMNSYESNNSWTPLSEIFKSKYSTSNESKVTPDKRTFLAHAGLPMGLVEVKKSRENGSDFIMLRYSNIEKVKELLSS